MLDGLTSRWTTPRLWACASASASEATHRRPGETTVGASPRAPRRCLAPRSGRSRGTALPLLADVVDTNDVRMSEATRRCELRAETDRRRRSPRAPRAGDASSATVRRMRGVPRAVDDPECASSDHVPQLVPADAELETSRSRLGVTRKSRAFPRNRRACAAATSSRPPPVRSLCADLERSREVLEVRRQSRRLRRP